MAPADVQRAGRLAGTSRLSQPPVTARLSRSSQGQPVPSHPSSAPATPQPVASSVISTGDNFALSIDLIECFFVVSLSVFKLDRFETYEREQHFCH